MTNLWEQTYRLRTGDFDSRRRLQPAAILDLFQDVAGEHAASLGMGYDDMIRRGMLWVVLRVAFEQLGQPALFDTVHVRTWPHPPGAVDFVRDYELLAQDGTPLVRGTSQWAVIGAEDRKLVASRRVDFPAAGVRDAHLFPERLRALRPAAEGRLAQTLRSPVTDVDLNGHVNNARYANYVMDALRPAQPLRRFQLDYHHEVRTDTPLRLYTACEGGAMQCRGEDEAGTRMFTAEIVCAGEEENHGQ